MFRLDPYLGGFEPEADYVNLAVEMNVAEHNVADGHFFSFRARLTFAATSTERKIFS